MGLISIDGNLLRKMIICGANELARNSRAVDALNVFPVPDGDTGTNMSHTVQAAAREVYKLSTPHIQDVAKAASSGSLRGARGNSGVILSQLFRGFAKGLEGKTVATAADLAEALTKAAEQAYIAIMKPKEGTILTIARAIGESAFECTYDDEDINTSLAFVIKRANEALNRTPSMLPELKQAGVVDAGGLGLILIFKGALAALSMTGDPVPDDKPQAADPALSPTGLSAADIRFAYCTEFLIDIKSTASSSSSVSASHLASHSTSHSASGSISSSLSSSASASASRSASRSSSGSASTSASVAAAQKPENNAETVLRSYLPTLGDSIVVIHDDNVVKVHVHTNNPGKVLEKALQFGMLSNIKIENMRLQHTSMLEFSERVKPAKAIGFVAVVAGQGLSELFTGLGVDKVIEGGQTMNPSAEDIAKAVMAVNAEHVIILPNNKNIILTAQQAVELTGAARQVHVIPTRSIPQGVACMVNYVDAGSVEDTLQAMNEAIVNVHSGQITQAVRDTVLDGHTIREGDILCLYDGEIVLVRTDLQFAAKELLDHMLSFGGDVVSVYYGEGVTADMANEIGAHVTAAYPDSEVEVYDGKQPLYSYILSVE